MNTGMNEPNPLLPSGIAPRFPLGRLLMTPGVKALLEEIGADLMIFLHRHVTGDWGDLTDEDNKTNEEALTHNARLLSSYHLSTGQEVWIITEADRSATTALLPEEY